MARIDGITEDCGEYCGDLGLTVPEDCAYNGEILGHIRNIANI